MAGHGSRLPSTVNGQLSDHGFVLPLSSHRFNSWRSIFTTLTPFVSRTSGRTLRIYARRLLTENNNQPINISPVGERHHIMGMWSSDNVHVGRGTASPLSVTSDSENFSSSSQDSENVVINMESNNLRENHRRSRSPSLITNVNNDASNSITEVNEDIFEESSDSSNDNENANPTASQNENEQGISINGDSLTDLLERHPELRNFLKIVWQYCVFFLIIIAKVVYDRFSSLLVIILFFLGFIFSNKIVKLSISYHERRSKRLMLAHVLTLLTIPLSIYTFYHRTSSSLYNSTLLLPLDANFSSLGELLWVVVVTDLVLKLSTVFIKGFVSLLPNFILAYKFRGNLFAIVEYTSQLYRSLAPVQPWISYLLDNYTGMEKVFGVFLSALYMLCKGPDIIFRVKNFHSAFKRFLQYSKYGIVPSKEELKDTGSLCPICQDDFVVPTMLQCKHIFCEQCVARWFDRERTCPMCRTKVADDPSYRDGSTSYSFQLY